MIKEFKLGKRMVGKNQAPFIIAEAGINHEGEIRKAFKLVDAAVKAGADCIKFQCHITEAEMIKTDIRPGQISTDALWDIIKRCELTFAEEAKIKKYCEKKGILFLSTPFSREAADRLEKLGVDAYKIGSGECNNLPLIEHVAKKNKPMIVATGMNDLNSISKTVSIIKEFGVPLVLMHCTSIYPTPYETVRLGALAELEKRFNVPVGLSDHSLGIYTCLGAVSLGACVLEKHFTVSKKWPGPDISISIDPVELTELVKGAKAIFLARGGRKNILEAEKPVIDFAYSTVVSIRDIKAGETLNAKNIWVKRPGTGEIKARHLKELIGKKAKVNIKNNTQLKWGQVHG